MLMLEKSLNQEVKKNVVKLVAIPSDKGADGLQFFEHILVSYQFNTLNSCCMCHLDKDFLDLNLYLDSYGMCIG